MGVIDKVIGLVFGNSGEMVRDTVEVFRENAEKGAQRSAEAQDQAMAQYAAEFAIERKGGFDRFMDGLNRLPRPALALGTLGLFVAAMVDPIWFAARMQGIALVPEPLWWLLGVIVSFYFGARHQVKTQEFQRSIVRTIAQVPQVVGNIRANNEQRHDSVQVAATGADSALSLAVIEDAENPALEDWRKAAA
jgi:hypothetical protein